MVMKRRSQIILFTFPRPKLTIDRLSCLDESKVVVLAKMSGKNIIDQLVITGAVNYFQ